MLKDVSLTEEKMVELINEFKRNHLAKGNLNISDTSNANDKFSRI